MALSGKPAREDLTDRECAKLLGGMIGGLVSMSDPASVQRAVKWWADNPDAWKLFGLDPSKIPS